LQQALLNVPLKVPIVASL